MSLDTYSKMELRDLVESDLDYCKSHDISRNKFTDPDERVDFAWTLEHEGQILGIGGIQKITDCCAWAWISMTPDALKHIPTIFRTLREYTVQVCQSVGITRLQAWSVIGFEESRRLLEHLDFEKEGKPMQDFVDGKPAQLYVRFIGSA